MCFFRTGAIYHFVLVVCGFVKYPTGLPLVWFPYPVLGCILFFKKNNIYSNRESRERGLRSPPTPARCAFETKVKRTGGSSERAWPRTRGVKIIYWLPRRFAFPYIVCVFSMIREFRGFVNPKGLANPNAWLYAHTPTETLTRYCSRRIPIYSIYALNGI